MPPGIRKFDVQNQTIRPTHHVLRSQANLKLYLRLRAGNAIFYFGTSILLYGFITNLDIQLTKPEPNTNKNKVSFVNKRHKGITLIIALLI